jgi:hypothetical protein
MNSKDVHIWTTGYHTGGVGHAVRSEECGAVHTFCGRCIRVTMLPECATPDETTLRTARPKRVCGECKRYLSYVKLEATT